MTRLRTSDGLDLDWLEQTFPAKVGLAESILQGAALGLELGLAEAHHVNNGGRGRLRLLDPDGFLFSNTIISSIFLEIGIA